MLERDRAVAAVLANVDAWGPSFQARENGEMEELLGHRVQDHESGLQELDDAIGSDRLDVARPTCCVS